VAWQRGEEAATSAFAGRRDRPRSIMRVRVRNEAGENPNRPESDGPDCELGGSDG
jgi:hypothetical protein